MVESSNKCTIHENTSRLHNEIIKQRLSCVPIHISDVENFPYKNYSIELNVENTSSDIIIVTTGDFTMNDLKTDKKVAKKEVRDIFPPFITGSGEYFIDLLRLRPSNNSNLSGEKIHLTCLLDKGTAKENGMFNVVSVCSYGFTVDQNKAEPELQKLKQKWKDDGLVVNEEEKNWRLLEGKRFVLNDSYDFSLKSIGIFTEHQLVETACSILIKKVKIQETRMETDEMKIEPSPTTLSNSFDITLSNEDYTIGKALEFVLYTKYYEGVKALSYCGFCKFHPHDSDSVIRLAYKEPVDISNVKQHLKDGMNELVNVYLKLKEESKKLNRV